MTLHTNAVPERLLSLLHRLMQDEAFGDFYLVGGTSLALRFGHRESVDIDLFTHDAFDAPAMALLLKQQYGLIEAETAENTVRGVINDIKIDLIAHRYPLIRPIEVAEGIRMLSVEDVAAMKLSAIANRGHRKDFWDCAELLRTFSLEELLGFCEAKYAGDSLWNVERSLCYFDDADGEPSPRDLRSQTWDQVKQFIGQHTRLDQSG